MKLIKWRGCREKFWNPEDLTNFDNVTTSSDRFSIDYVDKDNYNDDETLTDEVQNICIFYYFF